MEYEIVTLTEKFAVGVSARTNNNDPNMGMVIGGLWDKFYSNGLRDAISCKANDNALCIYTDYAGNETDDYTAIVCCEVTELPNACEYSVCKIPAGKYAKFIIKSDMRNTVAAISAAWQEIWQMDLPRAIQCDFEEYQDGNDEIHIYIGLNEGETR